MPQSRCLQARPVTYEQPPDFSNRFNGNPLRHVAMAETIVFDYADDEDFRGVGHIAEKQ